MESVKGDSYPVSGSEKAPGYQAGGGDMKASVEHTGSLHGSQPSPTSTFWPLFRCHWHQVITYCAVFWMFGMCVAFLGPTLLDLGCQTSTDMKTISWVFFSQLLCSLIGASVAGYLVQR